MTKIKKIEEDEDTKKIEFMTGRTDTNLMITWSRILHAKTPITGKPSKSGLIGV
jgi:hypothetical protein